MTQEDEKVSMIMEEVLDENFEPSTEGLFQSPIKII